MDGFVDFYKLYDPQDTDFICASPISINTAKLYRSMDKQTAISLKSEMPHSLGKRLPCNT